MIGFPEIIRRLPEADAPFRDIMVWLLQGPTASAIFVEAMADSVVPAHSHGAQWGVVVAGGAPPANRGGSPPRHAPGGGPHPPPRPPRAAPQEGGPRRPPLRAPHTGTHPPPPTARR